MGNSIEEWKLIENCSNYAVSSHGRVKNIETRKMLRGSMRQGYPCYTIIDDNKSHSTFSAHILVAKAFVVNDDTCNKNIVNHKDENKTNSHANNLEWVTRTENARYGTSQKRIGLSKQKPINEYSINGEYIRTWKHAHYISEIYGLSTRVFQTACVGLISTAYGRQWRYLQGDDITDITPITSVNVLKYNKNAIHDIDIPSNYLYIVDKLPEIETYINKLDNAIQNTIIPIYLKQELIEIRDFLIYNKPIQLGKH